ncbi:MAG: endonuclease III [Sulfobacillus thermotolerans]|nr:endonuclease III [Sulfobacillus thermotolerans]
MSNKSRRSSTSWQVTNAVVQDVLTVLASLYPNPVTELVHDGPWQLLVATMLSAQCTDRRVNMITPRIFARYPGPAELAQASVEEIEALIKDCGLYHSKARNLRATAEIIATQFDQHVPEDRETLMTLPGVGRKTANVVLSNAFGVDAIAVDTHVFRLAHRLGWSEAKDVLGTEEDLMRLLPQSVWSQAHHWLILHGRQVCMARNPQCARCPVAPFCEQRGVNKV